MYEKEAFAITFKARVKLVHLSKQDMGLLYKYIHIFRHNDESASLILTFSSFNYLKHDGRSPAECSHN